MENELKKEGSSICGYMRAYILDRDRHLCVICGTEGSSPSNRIHVHHIRYRIPCRTQDFITLCHDHHIELHRKHQNLKDAPKFAKEIKARELEKALAAS